MLSTLYVADSIKREEDIIKARFFLGGGDFVKSKKIARSINV